MKFKFNLIIFITVSFLCSCNSYDFVIESDYSYSGNFKKYRTFQFVANQSFEGTEDERSLIEKSLRSSLEAWGYKERNRRPDFVVFYTLYYEDFVFKGQNQPDFLSWLSSNFNGSNMVFKMDTLANGEYANLQTEKVANKDELYKEMKLAMQEGSLLISFYDPRRKLTVWQGYASGVFGSNELENDRILRSAVLQILDEYRLTAFDAS